MTAATDWSSPEGKHGKLYAKALSDVQLRMEQESLGTAVGARGYTTLHQADSLASALRLGHASLLLDVGAGRGWPGLYLAQCANCRVVLSELSQAALVSATTRARDLGIDHRVIRAGAHRLPLRGGQFDSVVSADVLWCLGPKLSVLRACHEALKPGGRLAFFTILISPDAHGNGRVRARAAGPSSVATRMTYPRMLDLAGFSDVSITNVTEQFEHTSTAWFQGTLRYAGELREAFGAREYSRLLRQRQAHLDAIRPAYCSGQWSWRSGPQSGDDAVRQPRSARCGHSHVG